METPTRFSSASVVSCENIRLAFLLTPLNGLVDVLVCEDVGNSNLNVCRGRVYLVAGQVFGPRQDMVVQIVCELYGMKSSGASWQAMSNSTITDEGSDSTIANPDDYPDNCRRPNAKPDDFNYYHAFTCVC